MAKTPKLLLGSIITLLLCGFLFSIVRAQQSPLSYPQVKQTDPMIDAMATQSTPAASAVTPQPGFMPMGSGISGIGGISGNYGMSGACPMMGQMGSGTTMGSGTNGAWIDQGSSMSGMNMSMTNMSGMNTSTSLYDADGRFVFWNLNPWWLLGWVILGLLALVILGGGVFGIVSFIRQTRRPTIGK